MAYKKRQRANKYEEKLRIDGSFEEAMQALLGVHPKQQNMNMLPPHKMYDTSGSVSLKEPNLEYPNANSAAYIDISKYQFIHVFGKTHNCILYIYFRNISEATIGMPVKTDKESGTFDSTIEIPESKVSIVFKLENEDDKEKGDKDKNEPKSAEFSFELLSSKVN
jgi:hypothetical protein